MIIFIYLTLILAMGLIGYAIYTSSSRYATRFKLAGQPQQPKKGLNFKPILKSIFPFVPRLLEITRFDVMLKKKLDASHVGLSPVELFNIKLLFMIIGTVLAIVIQNKIDPMVIVIVLCVAYLVPDIYLKQKTKQRREIIIKILPETIDLLGLCVEAGLDFTTAVKWIVEKIPNNPLLEEFNFVLEEIKWGKPRTQALKDMSKRLNIPEVGSFVQTLVQAERMGTPVSEAFAILSEDSRLQRFHRGERFAMQAPIKILLPLIFCILPVIGIVIGAPIFLKFMSGNLFGGLGGK